MRCSPTARSSGRAPWRRPSGDAAPGEAPRRSSSRCGALRSDPATPPTVSWPTTTPPCVHRRRAALRPPAPPPATGAPSRSTSAPRPRSGRGSSPPTGAARRRCARARPPVPGVPQAERPQPHPAVDERRGPARAHVLTAPSCHRRQRPVLPPVFLHADVGDRRARVDRLHHVDERETGDSDARQRLHLDPGAVGSTDDRPDRHVVRLDLGGRPHAVDRDRVAQRHQVRRALGGLDPRRSRHRDRVALGHPAATQQSRPPRRDEHPPGRRRSADADLLAGDVHHARGTGGVEVGELGHVALQLQDRRPGRPAPPRDAFRNATRAFARARAAEHVPALPPAGRTTNRPPRPRSRGRTADDPRATGGSARPRAPPGGRSPRAPSMPADAGRTKTSNET